MKEHALGRLGLLQKAQLEALDRLLRRGVDHAERERQRAFAVVAQELEPEQSSGERSGAQRGAGEVSELPSWIALHRPKRSVRARADRADPPPAAPRRQGGRWSRIPPALAGAHLLPYNLRPASPAMNFFCRVLGHTWVMKTEDPKIRWTTDAKTLARLDATAAGEPVFFWECARCRERRYFESREYHKTRPGEGRPGPASLSS